MSHAADIRKVYWGQINQILYTAEKKNVVMWATGNNGQISRNSENDDEIIGKWAIATENNTCNGEKSLNTVKPRPFITNTFFYPKKCEAQNLTTWTKGVETCNRQIDYIPVSNEHRWWITNAQTKGVAAPNSTLQHRTMGIDIKYDIIRTNKPMQNSTHVNNDIDQLRENAAQLQRDPNDNQKYRNLYKPEPYTARST